jgi:hypothetical protein
MPIRSSNSSRSEGSGSNPLRSGGWQLVRVPYLAIFVLLCSICQSLLPTWISENFPGTRSPLKLEPARLLKINTIVFHSYEASNFQTLKHAEIQQTVSSLTRMVKDEVVYAPGSDLGIGMKPLHVELVVRQSLYIPFTVIADCIAHLDTQWIAVKQLAAADPREALQTSLSALESHEPDCGSLRETFLPILDKKDAYPSTISPYSTVLQRFVEVLSYSPNPDVDAAFRELDALSNSASGMSEWELRSKITAIREGLNSQPRLNETIATTMHAEQRENRKKQVERSLYVTYAALFLILPFFAKKRTSEGNQPEAEPLFLKLIHLLGIP